jgi:cytochrome c-type biogenesis protein
MTVGSLVLALVAGMLSILSPCVLPILPIVLGAAASERKWGPVALAIGLSVSFVAIGLFVATVGFAVGLDAGVFRYVAAVLMLAIGLVLMLPGFQAQLAVASGPIANWADARFSGVRSGASGQFWVGVLLGAVWSPCVGPTLGAASLLAAQGRDLGQVGITMFAFGLGPPCRCSRSACCRAKPWCAGVIGLHRPARAQRRGSALSSLRSVCWC